MNHEPFAINHLKIIFFGSFLHYSTIVLQELISKNFKVASVITTPAKPQNRGLKLKPTDTALFARKMMVPVYELTDLNTIPKELERPDYLVVAGYGKLIPKIWLDFPKIMPVNLHPSLLPKYRGAFPAEWAILRGENETGVSLVQMTGEFDKGPLLAQQTLPITHHDTRQTLYEKLYALGASLLIKTLPQIASGDIKPYLQPIGTFVYARKLTREDGFISWNVFTEQMNNLPPNLDQKARAFAGWPGVWTMLPNGQRLKLIAIKPKVLVQLEGKKPVLFEQFASSYLQK